MKRFKASKRLKAAHRRDGDGAPLRQFARACKDERGSDGLRTPLSLAANLWMIHKGIVLLLVAGIMVACGPTQHRDTGDTSEACPAYYYQTADGRCCVKPHWQAHMDDSPYECLPECPAHRRTAAGTCCREGTVWRDSAAACVSDPTEAPYNDRVPEARAIVEQAPVFASDGARRSSDYCGLKRTEPAEDYYLCELTYQRVENDKVVTRRRTFCDCRKGAEKAGHTVIKTTFLGMGSTFDGWWRIPTNRAVTSHRLRDWLRFPEVATAHDTDHVASHDATRENADRAGMCASHYAAAAGDDETPTECERRIWRDACGKHACEDDGLRKVVERRIECVCHGRCGRDRLAETP